MPGEEGVPARRAALAMLDAVLRRGQTLDSAAQGTRLPPSDAGLATAIAGETLRRLPDLDALIDSATRQPLPDDSKARMVIRLALAQKIGLGTPDHALVATALPLVAGGPRRLVHGVLGTLLRRGLPAMDAPRLPDAVEERWRRAWGEEMVEAARRAIARRPPLDLSFKDDESASSYPLGRSLAPRHRRIVDSGAVTELPGYGEGCGKSGSLADEPFSAWWVQDLAASIPARLIPPAAMTVIDLCAAPGGKTMQLAAAGFAVTALDRSQSRLARLADNLGRTGLAAELIAADALEWRPPQPADAVLLDAPCSATGTFRRHPEVLYRARPAIIADAAALQARLIDHASAMLRPGGGLVYSVCSLEPEEGEAVVAAFLDRNPTFAIQPPHAGELPDGVASSQQGWVRVLPGMLEAEGGLDGFFVARLAAPSD
jgi:16S rRNA (cytosine967-C5)-methyltransferase